MIDRVDILIEFLEAGNHFAFSDLMFVPKGLGKFKIAGWSQYLIIASLNKKLALLELESVKLRFYDLLEAHPQLSNYMSGKEMAFILLYEGYGKASLKICEETLGDVEWFMDLPDNNGSKPNMK